MKATHFAALWDIFLVRGTCRVSRIYGGISDWTNDMESPSVALEPPRAARRVAPNTGGTAWRLPQEQTCRLRAAVLRIVVFLNIHIFNQLKRLSRHTAAAPRTCTGNRGRHVRLAKAGSGRENGGAAPMFVQIMTFFLIICVVASFSFFHVNTFPPPPPAHLAACFPGL